MFPGLVAAGADGYMAVGYSRLAAVLIDTVKELKAQNDLLLARISELEAR